MDAHSHAYARLYVTAISMGSLFPPVINLPAKRFISDPAALIQLNIGSFPSMSEHPCLDPTGFDGGEFARVRAYVWMRANRALS